MNRFQPTVAYDSYPIERRPVYRAEPRSEWTEWLHAGTETNTVSASAGAYTAFDLYGEGFCRSATHLAVLDFGGRRGAYDAEGPEFEFTGSAMLYAQGAQARRVTVEGYAKSWAIADTPFVETFRGHAFVESTESYHWPTSDPFVVRGVVAAQAPKRRARYQSPSRAYDAAKELGDWLGLTDEELAPIVGISRTTIYNSWKNGAEPRERAVARRLFHLHKVVRALHRRLGEGLTTWLEYGSPCPLKVLQDGNQERFEVVADKAILGNDTDYMALMEVNNASLVESDRDAAAFEAMKGRRSRRVGKPLPIE